MMATNAVPQALEDPAAYPLLVMDAGAHGLARRAAADDPVGLVDHALRAVLGARTRVDDVPAFRAALARSFVPSEVDGRRTYRNVPSGAFAGTVDEGELSGFQATLLARARDVVAQGLPLLDGLHSLTPVSDPEDARAIASVVRTAVERLRDEFGRRDGPRAPLVEEQLRILLGDPASTVVDPDTVGGSLGTLRALLGLTAGAGGFANTMNEEQQVTTFRLLVEYVAGLRQSWLTAAPFFGAGAGTTTAFVSARLRRLDLTMQTITEAVDRVRRQLDSVYVGEAERRTQPLDLPSRPTDRLTVEDLLEWADDVVAPDVAATLREGGRIYIADSVLPNATGVRDLLDEAARVPLPGALGAPRVRVALRDLAAQFDGFVTELTAVAPSTSGVASAVGHGTGPRMAARGVPAVPDVVGKARHVAWRTLLEAGLKPTVAGPTLGEADWSDDVVRTEPPAGTAVRPGTRVRVHLAQSSTAEIPDVRQLPVHEALELLRAAGLVPGSIRLRRSTQRLGTVVGMKPDPGAAAAAGTRVDLTLAASGRARDLDTVLDAVIPVASAASVVYDALRPPGGGPGAATRIAAAAPVATGQARRIWSAATHAIGDFRSEWSTSSNPPSSGTP